MEYIKDLESDSSPKIAKAAENIRKKKLDGYCKYLIDALGKEIKKDKAWKSQCELVKAIGITSCIEALPVLRGLIDNDYEHTILYRDIAFAILLLENTSNQNLSFLFSSIAKGNDLQISGACSAILYKKIVPSNDDIRKIISGISPYTADEGKKITPRCYIAAVAHLWPKKETENFLNMCKNSDWPGLVEIAESSLQGRESKIRLV